MPMPTILPIELVNKILKYKAELDNDVLIIQYKYGTNEEYYKINSSSSSLIKIEAIIIMKYLYPVYLSPLTIIKQDKMLYECGKAHYIKRIENRIKNINNSKNNSKNKNILCA
jgi:hypothetical protein